jgi:hypothetical protein
VGQSGGAEVDLLRLGYIPLPPHSRLDVLDNKKLTIEVRLYVRDIKELIDSFARINNLRVVASLRPRVRRRTFLLPTLAAKTKTQRGRGTQAASWRSTQTRLSDLLG